MKIDQYNKIATTLSARLNEVDNPVVVITSSSDKIDVFTTTIGVAKAYYSQKKSVLVIDARLGESTCANKGELTNQNGFSTIALTPCTDQNSYVNDSFITDLLNEVKVGFEIILVCTDSINHSTQSMLFASHSNGALLCEKKKSSRTDHIDEAISTIKNLNVSALGFVLES